MDTLYWGNGGWIFLHSISFLYPDNPTEQEKQQYAQFFHSLKYVLPCETCRSHYKKGIEQDMPIEPALESRNKLTRWLVDFHNSVNKRLGKPVVSYESVKEKYEMMKGNCVANNTEQEANAAAAANSRRKTDFLLYFVIALLIFIIVLGIYYFPKLKRPKISPISPIPSTI